MTKLCECGLADHKDQLTKFPTGCTVKFQHVGIHKNLAGRLGTVTGHCNDGRAVVVVDGHTYTHTFHYPPFTLIGAPVDLDTLQGTVATQAATIEHLKSLNAEQAKAIRSADGKLQAAAAENEKFRSANLALSKMQFAAAAEIERLTAENAALRIDVDCLEQANDNLREAIGWTRDTTGEQQ